MVASTGVGFGVRRGSIAEEGEEVVAVADCGFNRSIALGNVGLGDHGNASASPSAHVLQPRNENIALETLIEPKLLITSG
jgi:hypothetical protein